MSFSAATFSVITITYTNKMASSICLYCHSLQFFAILCMCFVYMTLYSYGLKFTSDSVSDVAVLLNEGRKQLEMLEANTQTTASYGKCWSNAVTDLKNGCKNLSEESQSVLSLRLTDCFLQMSGQPPVNCQLPQRKIKECLQELSDRGFNAFTVFYTHAQSICYFLQSKIWHEETEKTIDLLAFTSQMVTTQLAMAEKGQEALLEQQKESMSLQRSLASDIESSKIKLNRIMNDIHEATEKQHSTLLALLDQLASLQSWVLGEISWFESLAFYFFSIFLIIVFTSSTRTNSARLPLVTLLALNYVAERILTIYLFGEKSEGTAFQLNEIHTAWVWFIRKLTVSLSTFIFIITAFSYINYNQTNYKILQEIKLQNQQILNSLSKNEKLKDLSAQSVRRNNTEHIIPLPFKDLAENNKFECNTYFSPFKETKLNKDDIVPSIKSVTPIPNLYDEQSNISVRRSTRLLSKQTLPP